MSLPFRLSKINVLKILVFNFGSSVLKRSYARGDHLQASLERFGVIPDLLTKVPDEELIVKFSCDDSVRLGNQIKPCYTQRVPMIVEWDYSNDKFYTIYMGDLDAPAENDHSQREWLHWLIVNIPGNRIKAGSLLATYIPPLPASGTGIHRYIFLVLEQKKETNFSEFKPLGGSSPVGRPCFSIGAFSRKYCLSIVGVNFFRAKCDDSVKKIAEKWMKGGNK